MGVAYVESVCEDMGIAGTEEDCHRIASPRHTRDENAVTLRFLYSVDAVLSDVSPRYTKGLNAVLLSILFCRLMAMLS